MWKAFRARTFVLRKRLALLTPERIRLRRNRRATVALAQRWLGGLKGIEVGGAAHNDFEVDALNVDRYAEYDTVYKREELRMWGTVKKVDLVAPGDDLPLKDQAVDFVLASHVIEHFPDPVAALSEWVRVSRRYLFLVVPHRDRTFDRGRDLTPVDELLDRHARGFASEEDAHWSVWTCESFLALCDALGLVVCDHRDPDYEGGNGFVVVIDAAASRAASAATDREGFEPSIRF
ncbi:MAG TPA: methyltransferase domain-containing protein [Thermoleophilaceae bacterium]|nr:methyltransferase domain-containing protein [Thermoleophilaceae bacterium]